MPDKFKDVMEDSDVTALASWLSTFKNTSVNTPSRSKRSSMQPQLKSKVRCADREVGEVSKVIMDPLSHEVSHLVVSMNGAGERQVPMGAVQAVAEDLVQLRSSSSEVLGLPPFKRDDYVTLHEVEIPGLERHIHVTPGEVLVPFPELERNVKRRTFFANLTYVVGLFIGLPLVFPVLKFLMKPMYAPLDNRWLKIGNIGKVKADDAGTQFQYKRKVKEAYMPEAEIEKNVWLVKATPAVLEKVYQGKDMEFLDTRPGKPSGPIRRTCPTSHFPVNVPTSVAHINGENIRCLGKSFSVPAT